MNNYKVELLFSLYNYKRKMRIRVTLESDESKGGKHRQQISNLLKSMTDKLRFGIYPIPEINSVHCLETQEAI